jgi:pre-mRNA-splicing factor SYF1
MFLFDNN